MRDEPSERQPPRTSRILPFFFVAFFFLLALSAIFQALRCAEAAQHATPVRSRHARCPCHRLLPPVPMSPPYSSSLQALSGDESLSASQSCLQADVSSAVMLIASDSRTSLRRRRRLRIILAFLTSCLCSCLLPTEEGCGLQALPHCRDMSEDSHLPESLHLLHDSHWLYCVRSSG